MFFTSFFGTDDQHHGGKHGKSNACFMKGVCTACFVVEQHQRHLNDGESCVFRTYASARLTLHFFDSFQSSNFQAKKAGDKESPSSNMLLMCAPVSSGSIPPSMMKAEGKAPVRSLSPLSDSDVGEPIPIDVQSESTRKRSRILRFPCKARGVPDNHNANNAYIDVPSNASHGAVVLCSHPICAASGRKFRYCSVCMVPVAKRNFSKRHGHGLLLPPQLPYIELEGGGGVEEEDAGSARSKRQRRMNSFHTLPADFGEALADMEEDDKLVTKKEVPDTIVVKPATAESVEDASAASAAASSSIDTALSAQEHRWLALYRNRPTPNGANEASVRTWMAAILEAAEFTSSPTSAGENAESREDDQEVLENEEDIEDSALLHFLLDKDFLLADEDEE